MTFLRRMLYLQAFLKGGLGLCLAVIPSTLLDLFGMAVPPERAWMRLLGINLIVLAMLAWLIARRIEEAWWWSWAFVLGNLATAIFAVLKAAFGFGSTSGAAYWWLLTAVSILLAAGTAWGLARTGQERLPS